MAQAPRGQQQQQNVSLGFPPDFKVFSLDKPQGMNTKDARSAIDDNELSWQENFIRLGTSDMRTLYDHGTALYTPAGDSILSFFPFNFAAVQYHLVFLTSGKAVQVRVSDGAVTNVSTLANTFWSAGLNTWLAGEVGPKTFASALSRDAIASSYQVSRKSSAVAIGSPTTPGRT